MSDPIKPVEETPEEKQARMDARAAFDYKAHVAEQGANLGVEAEPDGGNVKPSNRGDRAAFPPVPAGHYNPPVTPPVPFVVPEEPYESVPPTTEGPAPAEEPKPEVPKENA